MSTGSLEEVLDAARKLPIEQRRLLAEELIKDTSPAAPSIPTLDALDAVERTLGAMKGLDRDTVIWLAEDEELCGY